MDVSQSNNAKDSTFAWSTHYKSDSADDFALHLVNETQEADPYESVDKSHDIDDDEPVRESKKSDDTDDDRHDQVASNDRDSPENVHPQDRQLVVSALPVNNLGESGVTPTSTASTSSAPVVTPQTSGNNSDSVNENGTQLQRQNNATVANPSVQTGNHTQSGLVGEKPLQRTLDPKSKTNETAQPVVTAATAVAVSVTASNAASVGKTSSAINSIKDTTATNKGASASGNTVASSTTSQTQSNSAASVQEAQTEQSGKNTAPVTVMEKLRQDEMAKLSEKEVLSAKISEMLNSSKGKISLTSSGNNSSPASSSGLLSGTTIADLATTQTKSETAIATVTQNSGNIETPIIVPNGGLAASLLMPTASGDPTLSANAALTGGAVTGIESTSSNSASQASMAGRAATQAGSPAEQVSTQIAMAAKDGVDRIKVQLHPAELGRIDIKLELGNDGRVIAVISADNQDSLDLLKQDSKQLEQALKDAGFETGSDSLSFSLNQGQGDNEEPSGATVAGATVDEDENLDLDLATISTSSGNTDGNLDIQV